MHLTAGMQLIHPTGIPKGFYYAWVLTASDQGRLLTTTACSDFFTLTVG